MEFKRGDIVKISRYYGGYIVIGVVMGPSLWPSDDGKISVKWFHPSHMTSPLYGYHPHLLDLYDKEWW